MAAVRSNPAAYPARRALIYSWNECDEGGSALIPTWTPSGPNTAILSALAAANR